MNNLLEQENEQNKPKRSKVKVALLVIGLLLLIIIGTAGGIGLYIANALQPVDAAEQEVRVSIQPGSGSTLIAKELETKGLIKNSSIFTYYLKWHKQGSKFQAGEYSMKPGMTFDEMIDKLNRGDIVKEDMIRITIPEGYTIDQIAAKISEQTPWKKEAFLQIADAPIDVKTEATASIPDNKNLKHRLEGYLFPETYEFKKGSSEQEFIERTLQQLDKKLATLPPDWKDKLKERGLSIHQMLTIASLIEREVVVDEERALVSGVIQNRLKKNMPLQIDATVQYLFDKSKDRLLEKDLQIQSPYNTYLNVGLPPGPIASPSLASMKAAIYPEETKYLFYVTKKDGTKGHLFAETFEAHKKNIAESKKAGN
ncbi:endolytic murein transglycosylase [Paenibacillus marchantiophytorum]|uniref:Endolytic murein transglycosylase n=1 Tax=Paenibacillus marchantiophytorum TaxID=1619310 RepID=A0ABQ1ESQ5_9BACL|nr:endolytic transglycosylase MltG [Paenibacillus marchantiophytorum]GFZ85698.1 endolytic murein transglycosylase [Paenibacillus marchantiophytorum]